MCLSLSGCGVAVMMEAEKNDGEMVGMFEIAFPAVMLVSFDDGTEELLSGELIGHASGSSKINVTGPTWGKCTGIGKKSGEFTMTCENGLSMSQNGGKSKPKMSGVEVNRFAEGGKSGFAAMGWGKLANEASVRKAIADKRA